MTFYLTFSFTLENKYITHVKVRECRIRMIIKAGIQVFPKIKKNSLAKFNLLNKKRNLIQYFK